MVCVLLLVAHVGGSARPVSVSCFLLNYNMWEDHCVIKAASLRVYFCTHIRLVGRK